MEKKPKRTFQRSSVAYYNDRVTTGRVVQYKRVFIKPNRPRLAAGASATKWGFFFFVFSVFRFCVVLPPTNPLGRIKLRGVVVADRVCALVFVVFSPSVADNTFLNALQNTRDRFDPICSSIVRRRKKNWSYYNSWQRRFETSDTTGVQNFSTRLLSNSNTLARVVSGPDRTPLLPSMNTYYII